MAKIPMMKKMQQIRTLSALWKHRGRLYAMLRDMLRGTYRASFLTMAALIASVIYLLSPVNILTDMVPVIGWVDDGFIIYFLLKRLMYEMDRYDDSKTTLKLIK